ncbi:MAG: transglycosylase SLT domain-containing protein [Alphaproteobacteria bacterium]|nr:transglycosylase SLT domain-containing protein [Alphaproteobacteria bacterium]
MGAESLAATAINSLKEQADNGLAPTPVVRAIQSAAVRTGVDFSYLMQKASQESSFDPVAKASSSSATGLFQFTEQTWLHMIKEHGEEYGLARYARSIRSDVQGRLRVENPVVCKAILALRKNPKISAEMAGELDKENAAHLARTVGGTIGGTELYLAHFLGATGAARFLARLRETPNASAASVLPQAADANESIFYDKTGSPRTFAQIYGRFAEKFADPARRIASLMSEAAQAAPVQAIVRPVRAPDGARRETVLTVAHLMPRASGLSESPESEAIETPLTQAVASIQNNTLMDAILFGQEDTDAFSESTLPAFYARQKAYAAYA